MFIITLFYVAWYLYLVFTPQEERPFIVNLKDFFYNMPTKAIYDLHGNFIKNEFDYENVDFVERHRHLIDKVLRLFGWLIIETFILLGELIYVISAYKYNKYLAIGYFIFWVGVLIYNRVRDSKTIEEYLEENEFPRVCLDNYFNHMYTRRRIYKFFNIIDLIFFVSMAVVLF